MTFLTPWAMLAGVLGAAGLLVLHLVARQRPAAYPLPTARFVPDRRTLVSRVSRRPRDLGLLALRVLLVLSAAAAFARPVLTSRRSAHARVLVLDRSSVVADAGDALRRARELSVDGTMTRLVTMDSVASTIGGGATALDSIARLPATPCCSVGSLSAALVAARRAAPELGARADSVELVIVSPLMEGQWDAATDSLRGLWPGAVRIVRVGASTDSSAVAPLERAVPDADVLGPALSGRATSPSSSSARALRLVRGVPASADSAFARAGGVEVRWDSIGARRAEPQAIAMGDDVIVATVARTAVAPATLVLARWADGTPAATERPLGSGCMREVGIGVPAAGDLPLRPAFQRMVRGLTDACASARRRAGAALDSVRMARLAGVGGAASGAALASGVERPTPLAPWLLGLALACALAELALRARRGEPEAA